MKILVEKAVIEQALDYLENSHARFYEEREKAITALREVLAEQERKAKYDERFERLEKFEQQAEQEPEYKGWYCAHCERGVDGSEVTFHEQHEVCGRVITNDVPPKPVKQEPYRWILRLDNGVELVTSEKPDDDEVTFRKTMGDTYVEVYAAPVRTKELTDDEKLELARSSVGKSRHWLVEAAITAYKEKNK